MPIRGYEGLYEASDWGRVRCLNYRRTGQVKVMKGRKSIVGYIRIQLSKNGIQRDFLVHRLVWESFNGPIPEGYELDHLSTERSDNRLSNLRCVTCKENNNNPITKIKRYKGVRKACGKSVLQINKETGKVIKRWECAIDAHRELGVDFRSISACCKGKVKSAGGYRWIYFMPPALIYSQQGLGS